MIDELERRQDSGMVIVQMPGLSSETTVAALNENRPVLLVAPPGRVDPEANVSDRSWLDSVVRRPGW